MGRILLLAGAGFYCNWQMLWYVSFFSNFQVDPKGKTILVGFADGVLRVLDLSQKKVEYLKKEVSIIDLLVSFKIVRFIQFYLVFIIYKP